MEDVLETYERPYDAQEPVVCVDEKPVTLHADIRPPSPATPGREARRDSEYERCGTANVFCAVEPKGGRHFTSPTPDRSAFEFARFVCELAMQYPDAKTIHLVMDNLNTHTVAALYNTFEPAEARRIARKLEIHYTPKHGSWLNMAEIELSVFGRQCLTQHIPDVETLQRDGHAQTQRYRRRHSSPHKSDQMSPVCPGKINKDNSHDQRSFDALTQGDKEGRKHEHSS